MLENGGPDPQGDKEVLEAAFLQLRHATDEEGSAPLTREQRIASAMRLLVTAEVRASSLAQKVQFLASKGLDRQEIREAFAKAGQAVDPAVIESAVCGTDGQPTETSVGPVRSAVGVVVDTIKLAGYASLAVATFQKWAPFRVSIRPTDWAAEGAGPTAATEDGPAEGDWYDMHTQGTSDAADATESGVESGSHEQLALKDAELERVRAENSALRSELAALKGQLRQLQRKVGTASPVASRMGGKSAEDLLKPFPKSPLSPLSYRPSAADPPDPLLTPAPGPSPSSDPTPTPTPDLAPDPNLATDSAPTPDAARTPSPGPDPDPDPAATADPARASSPASTAPSAAGPEADAADPQPDSGPSPQPAPPPA